jgi:hypothetical protein
VGDIAFHGDFSLWQSWLRKSPRPVFHAELTREFIDGGHRWMPHCHATMSVDNSRQNPSKSGISGPVGKCPLTAISGTTSVHHMFSPVIHESLALVINSKLSPNELKSPPPPSQWFRSMMVQLSKGSVTLPIALISSSPHLWRDIL